jgi:FlaA1/EpsC-like NDP-sugar epimerase
MRAENRAQFSSYRSSPLLASLSSGQRIDRISSRQLNAMTLGTMDEPGMAGADLNRFDGKVAIVTGSTQGLGEAICELMTARGLAGLIVTGRDQDRGEAVASRLRAAGCETLFVRADLSRHEEVLSIAERCDRAFGRVDILVNSAGNTDRGTILDKAFR